MTAAPFAPYPPAGAHVHAIHPCDLPGDGVVVAAYEHYTEGCGVWCCVRDSSGEHVVSAEDIVVDAEPVCRDCADTRQDPEYPDLPCATCAGSAVA